MRRKWYTYFFSALFENAIHAAEFQFKSFQNNDNGSFKTLSRKNCFDFEHVIRTAIFNHKTRTIYNEQSLAFKGQFEIVVGTRNVFELRAKGFAS